MFGIGGWEMLLIGVVALLVFGPKRLPELARTLGKGMAEFRSASSDLRRSMDLDLDPARTSAPDPATQPPAQAGAPADSDAPSPEPKPSPEPEPEPEPQDESRELEQAATPGDAPVGKETAVTGAVPTDPSAGAAAEVAPAVVPPADSPGAPSASPSASKDRTDSGSH